MKNDVLKRVIETVTFLFSAFHSFLPNMSPPEEVLKLSAVGFASFLVLFALCLIAGLTGQAPPSKHRKRWIVVGSLVLVLLSGVTFDYYLRNTNRLTFSYPPGTQSANLYVKGTVLEPEAESWMASNPGATVAELVANSGGLPNREKVWTRESIGDAKLLLTWNYVFWVALLASSIFVLTEGLLGKTVGLPGKSGLDRSEPHESGTEPQQEQIIATP